MGEAEPTWKDYAQAFSDVVEALDRVDQFMREQHFTTLDLFRGETGDREVLSVHMVQSSCTWYHHAYALRSK